MKSERYLLVILTILLYSNLAALFLSRIERPRAEAERRAAVAEDVRGAPLPPPAGGAMAGTGIKALPWPGIKLRTPRTRAPAGETARYPRINGAADRRRRPGTEP